MDVKEFNSEIGDLVGQDKIKEAIKMLRNVLRDCPELDDVILQSSRFTELMRKIRNGTISFEDASITKNKIRMAILSLADEIEESVSKSESLHTEFGAHKENIGNWNITQNHSGNGDIIAGDKIVNK